MSVTAQLALPPVPILDHRQRRNILIVVCTALALVVAAVASLNVALPELARDTDATQTQLQWIVDSYALVFAALLLPAGALGDRFGRRGMLIAGLVIFGLSSMAAFWLDAPGWLIALRAVSGVGAALIMPVTLSTITSVFPPEERGRAVGTWAGVAGGGAILGLLVSGALLERFSWNAVFAINVVLAVVALVGTIAVVPSTSDPDHAAIDPIGAVSSALGLAALIFAIIEGPVRGWTDAAVVAAFAVGVAGLAAFVLWELRRDQPMLDPRLFRLRGFTSGTISITLQFFAAFGFFFVALQYLQSILGYSPLESGLAMLPMALALIATAQQADRLAARFGPRLVGAAGLATMAVGMLVLATLGTESAYLHVAIGLTILGLGSGFAATPATSSIVASLPQAKQGVASAVNDTARELGGALGIAVLGSALTSAYRSSIADAASSLPPDVGGRVEESLAYTLAAANQLDRPDLAIMARAAFVNGLQISLVAASATLVVGAVAVAMTAPGRHVRGSEAPASTMSDMAAAPGSAARPS